MANFMENERIAEKYRIVKPIGSGANGQVYVVCDEHINKIFAMKAVKNVSENVSDINCLADDFFAKTHSNEIEVMKTLSLPGLPRLVDVFHKNDKICIIMEYIEGPTLEEYIKELAREKRHLSEEQICSFSEQIAEILSYLHKQSIPFYYADLKPQNIIVDGDERIHLVDFGACIRLLDKTEIYSTPGYAAPELKKGVIGAQSDIYSLGKVMLTMITGQSPLCFPHVGMETLQKFQISKKLSKVILKCCREDAKERFHTMEEFLAAISSLKEKREKYVWKAIGCLFDILLYCGTAFTAYGMEKWLWESRSECKVFLLCGITSLIVSFVIEKRITQCRDKYIMENEHNIYLSAWKDGSALRDKIEIKWIISIAVIFTVFSCFSQRGEEGLWIDLTKDLGQSVLICKDCEYPVWEPLTFHFPKDAAYSMAINGGKWNQITTEKLRLDLTKAESGEKIRICFRKMYTDFSMHKKEQWCRFCFIKV